MELKSLQFLKRWNKSFLILCLTVLWSYAQAQDRSVSGKIKDETGEGLPGVSVLIKGTSTGTISDIDGNFSISIANPEAVLIFSYIGYLAQEVAVGTRAVLDVSLEPDITSLEEIVIVGYGEQKKSVVTGAISSVKSKDLETMPISRIEQALQGRTSGLTIAASSGQPGSSSTVRVRGLTSINSGSNNPLWVVDGVIIDNGGIGYLNQSDILSIEVLKDAASQAIYGSRAAAGVILVTTKKGSQGKVQLNYNGFYGVSAPARKLDLLNAKEYATLRNEAAFAGGATTAPFPDAASLGEGSDWQDAVFSNGAKRQNHELSLSGGNEVSTYYASFGYWDQEGIVLPEISHYKRFNVRLNSTHKVAKWLTIGQNVGYSKEKTLGIGNTNSEYGGPLSSAINLDPITPIVVTDPTIASGAPYTNANTLKNSNGDYYGISTIVQQEMTNPLAYAQTRLGNHSWADNIVGNAYTEITLIEGLKIKSTVGLKMAFYGDESFNPVSYLNATNITPINSFRRTINRNFNYNIENTISYSKVISGHSFNILLGQGAYENDWNNGWDISYQGIAATNYHDAAFLNVPQDQRTASGSNTDGGGVHRLSSEFARINYDFNEKYLFTGIVRRDGSSNFGQNNKYGIFPSVSVGWVASKENFWPKNNVIDFLKIRGGYGVVGQDQIGKFNYLATIGSGRYYAFGTDGSYQNGFSPNAPANPDLKWESTAQLNVGFEANIFNDISVTFDYYKKKTSDILMNPRIPAYVGAISNPAANVANVENTGVELELGYRKKIGDVNISVNGNASYLQNKVTGLGFLDFVSGGESFQASNYPITRTAVGQPIGSFYGFRRLGIFQTAEDVANHKNAEGKAIQPDAKPGDFIWDDINGDGVITEDDRTFIGNPTPTWSYGLTFNIQYKGFDFMMMGQGVAGNTVFQGLRRLDIGNANFQTKALGRWTGPGTSNDFPRLVNGDPNKNFTNPSDFYLEKGDYFRIKVVQLGYSLPKSLIDKIGFSKARVYVMSENLFTFTKYTGFDPEIGGGVMSIDRGVYPQARSFMLGVNVTF